MFKRRRDIRLDRGRRNWLAVDNGIEKCRFVLADKRALAREGLLAENDKRWVLAEGSGASTAPTLLDQASIDRVAIRFSGLRGAVRAL